VRTLQERLLQLGYWLPGVDGEFGDGTAHAVVALQKAAGLARDGVVGPRTRAALAHGALPRPRSTHGHVLEVDKARQLVLFVDDGRVSYVLDTSTGSGATYTNRGHTAVAVTPSGRFAISRAIDGMRVSPLGQLTAAARGQQAHAAAGDGRLDRPRRLLGRQRGGVEHVPLVRAARRFERAVHVGRRVGGREAVAGAAGEVGQQPVERRQQDHVVQLAPVGRAAGRELGQEPRSDDPVEHHVEAAGHQLGRGGEHRTRDGLVLLACLGQPRVDVAADHEPPERVGAQVHRRRAPRGEQRGDGRLADGRRPGHDDEAPGRHSGIMPDARGSRPGSGLGCGYPLACTCSRQAARTVSSSSASVRPHPAPHSSAMPNKRPTGRSMTRPS
jgi:hypothetical protein